jgi:hypothetical protein
LARVSRDHPRRGALTIEAREVGVHRLRRLAAVLRESTLELADQEGVWFGHYDLNDFRFLGVRKRKPAEERHMGAVPGR